MSLGSHGTQHRTEVQEARDKVGFRFAYIVAKQCQDFLISFCFTDSLHIIPYRFTCSLQHLVQRFVSKSVPPFSFRRTAYRGTPCHCRPGKDGPPFAGPPAGPSPVPLERCRHQRLGRRSRRWRSPRPPAAGAQRAIRSEIGARNRSLGFAGKMS